MTDDEPGPVIPLRSPMPTGLDRFRTRHGDATLHWSSGRPSFLENASLPDGSRGGVELVDLESRRLRLNGTIVRGVAKVDRDDIKVALLPAHRTHLMDDDCERFFAIVSADAAFMAAIRERSFAAALLSVIGNNTVVRSEEWFEFGERSGPALVAELRGLGEGYMDFAWGSAGSYSPAERGGAVDHLTRLGFRFLTHEETAERYCRRYPEYRPKDDE